MPCFQQYVSTHGEIGAQDIVERLERYEGLKAPFGTSLEDRWNRVMDRDDDKQAA